MVDHTIAPAAISGRSNQYRLVARATFISSHTKPRSAATTASARMSQPISRTSARPSRHPIDAERLPPPQSEYAARLLLAPRHHSISVTADVDAVLT